MVNNLGIHASSRNDNLKTPNTILIHRRKQLKLTQKEVAKRAGIVPSAYQKFEDGTRNFTSCRASTFMAVCSALELPPYEFFKEDTTQRNGDGYDK